MIEMSCDRTGDFAALATALNARVAATLEQAAADIRDDARARVMALRNPARPLPSRLAESIDLAAGTDRLEVLVRADAPHAAAVEFGTRHMAPRPYLSPAAEGARGTLAARIDRALKAALERTRT